MIPIAIGIGGLVVLIAAFAFVVRDVEWSRVRRHNEQVRRHQADPANAPEPEPYVPFGMPSRAAPYRPAAPCSKCGHVEPKR